MIRTELSTLIDACRSAHDIGSDLGAVGRRHLTKEEKELLAAASMLGRFTYIHPESSKIGWITADRKDFRNASDPSVAERYLEAFVTLCKRGHISHTGGALFELTPTGWEQARSEARDVAL